MKKKLWCVLCIVTCMLLIPACGQKKESGKEKTEKAEQAETIISLTEEQVKAVRTTLNNELQKEGRKSFWQGVIVNFVFFVSGAIVSYIVSKYLV